MTPYERGACACKDGTTTNPYGLPQARSEWSRGHDETFDLGLCELPRFGRQKGKR